MGHEASLPRKACYGRGAGLITGSDAELAGPLPTPSTISDLAYFGEVEAMVTASRDSTVKVWEADWQIRMVFVGHTGAPHHGGS